MKSRVKTILCLFIILILNTMGFPVALGATAEKPRGIYVLDSRSGTNRDANIRDYDFVTGYVWRMNWASFESATNPGVYDFSKVDDIIAKVQAVHKKLSIILGGAATFEPAYIALTPGVTTWLDPGDPEKGYPSSNRAVPWDPYLLERFRAFCKALGDHVVPDAETGGALTPLRNHPTLANINFGIAGLGEIRERTGIEISGFPNYNRNNFITAIKNSLHAQVDQFPNKSVYIGFWRVTDSSASPELWEDIRSAILNEFDGIKNPSVGFWMENLAASKDAATGTVTGYPNTSYSAPLYLSRDSTPILFQALQGWNSPFSDPAKTANATPADGIKYAYDTFGCGYFELYVADIDDQNYWPAFQAWHDLFFGGDYAPSDLNHDGVTNTLDLLECVNVILGTEQDPGIIDRAKKVAAPLDQANTLDVVAVVNAVLR